MTAHRKKQGIPDDLYSYNLTSRIIIASNRKIYPGNPCGCRPGHGDGFCVADDVEIAALEILSGIIPFNNSPPVPSGAVLQ